MRRKLCFKIIPFATASFAILVLGCAKQEEEGRLSPKTQTVQVGQTTAVDYGELLTKLDSLQNKIREQPANTELHNQLVEMAVDQRASVIRAVGKGELPTKARSRLIAQQAARDAAHIDACQWLAYVLQWRDHPDSPDFGKIHADLPGARTVHQVTEGNITKVMVESVLP